MDAGDSVNQLGIERTAAEPFFVGHKLAQVRAARDLTPEQQAASLGWPTPSKNPVVRMRRSWHTCAKAASTTAVATFSMPCRAGGEVMDQADAFLTAILERPDDATARLVFADWLDEHGEPDLAF